MNLALWLMYTNYSHVLQAIVTKIFVKWTERHWRLQYNNWVDFMQCAIIFSWSYLYYDYMYYKEPDEKNWIGVLDKEDGAYNRLIFNIVDSHKGI